jgi:threonine/homoserine/homoserine lactone efflux protein
MALFFLAIFSHFVHPDSNWTETGLMGITAGVIDTVWYIIVAVILTGVGATRISRYGENVILKVTGVFLF